MTINPSIVSTDAYNHLDGSISLFNAHVDEAKVASVVVISQYRMTINPAYNAPNPDDSHSFTRVGLTQSGALVVDLENTYITTEVALALNLSNLIKSKGSNTSVGVFFVGWKYSIETIERYDIMVTTTPIYTHSFTGE